MLIYLDANIVQYCADYEDFVFGEGTTEPVINARLLEELIALRRLVDLALKVEQMEVANKWHVAAPTHLMRELYSGKPTVKQRSVYSMLLQAWSDSEWRELIVAGDERVSTVEKSLRSLNLKDLADRWHLAESIVMGASWFLTHDKDILKKTRKAPTMIGIVQGVRIARPSECVESLSFDPVFGLGQR
jgi:hypothetical protein